MQRRMTIKSWSGIPASIGLLQYFPGYRCQRIFYHPQICCPPHNQIMYKLTLHGYASLPRPVHYVHLNIIPETDVGPGPIHQRFLLHIFYFVISVTVVSTKMGKMCYCVWIILFYVLLLKLPKCLKWDMGVMSITLILGYIHVHELLEDHCMCMYSCQTTHPDPVQPRKPGQCRELRGRVGDVRHHQSLQVLRQSPPSEWQRYGR
jgi:hypothetical protein